MSRPCKSTDLVRFAKMCRISGQPRWCCITLGHCRTADRRRYTRRRRYPTRGRPIAWLVWPRRRGPAKVPPFWLMEAFSGHADKPEHAGGHRLSTGRNLQLKAMPDFACGVIAYCWDAPSASTVILRCPAGTSKQLVDPPTPARGERRRTILGKVRRSAGLGPADAVSSARDQLQPRRRMESAHQRAHHNHSVQR